MKSKTTRFAPSPTGFLHVGNLRSALLSYLTAKKYGLRFLLRIDDTDALRSSDEYIRAIKEDLAKFKINYDYTFRQSDRIQLYHAMLEACIRHGLVYEVTDTEEELELLRTRLMSARKAPAYKKHYMVAGKGAKYWRFDLGSTYVEFDDLICGTIKIDLSSISDPVICKPTGEFTYIFASIVDDLLENVSHIIRGADHITNTAVQLCMGRKIIEAGLTDHSGDLNFGHYPLFSTSGGKMSKRIGSFALKEITDIHPLALVHYLISAGSSKNIGPVTELDEMVDGFNFENYSASSLIEYNLQEIIRYQHQIFQIANYDLVSDFLPVDLSSEWSVLRDSITTIEDANYYYGVLHDKRRYSTPIISDLDPRELINSGSGESRLFLRHILTGRASGPKLKDLIPLIRPEILEYRLSNYAQTSIKFYNSTTRTKEIFKPIKPQKVQIYGCGPTVYNIPHLGNMRSFTFFDILYRILSLYYPTTYVRNVTDIDDKIILMAKAEGKTPKTFSEEVYKKFLVEANILNLKKPTFEPMVTKYIPQIIESIENLMSSGIGYKKDDGIYFDISKLDKGYNYNLFDCSMRHEEDFALWKYKDDFGWDAKFGYGRPGWHIECTVMSKNTISLPFDIHCGGRDLMFPHHTNEAAQAYGLYNSKTANYWLHTNFINMDGLKMSKSLNNTLTVSALGIHPMIIKTAFLLTHYRQELFWSDQVIQEASALYNKWRRLLGQAGARVGGYPLPKFLDYILDDMNTPMALRVLDADINETNSADVIASFGLLGIDFNFSYLQDEGIKHLVTERQAARQEGNFTKADEIRKRLDLLKVKLEEGNQCCWYQEV